VVHQPQGWLLSVQQKLYQWSRQHPTEAIEDLWGWVTDLRNLESAWRRVSSNEGHKTPGIDGLTVSGIASTTGPDAYLRQLREELRAGTYRPTPVRRAFIPKRGQPGKVRPLGIPTVRDRIVQAALLNILEPIFEAGFLTVSYGFRPNRACRDALEHIRRACKPKPDRATGQYRPPPYQWVIEGDIKACFDNIDHHVLMDRLRKRVIDRRVGRLVRAFLKAGFLSEEAFYRTDSGTPQGGILSPLLANIVLSAIEERYSHWIAPATSGCDPERAYVRGQQHRTIDRRKGRVVFFPFRYADDFVVLVNGAEEDAGREKEALATFLRDELKLELSPEKTLVTPLTNGFVFLGHRVRMREHQHTGYWPRLEIPPNRRLELRRRVKALTTGGAGRPLDRVLRELGWLLRGWGYFYRHCTGASRVFSTIDWYVDQRVRRWLRKKYPKTTWAELASKYLRTVPGSRRRRWAAERETQFLVSSISVFRHRALPSAGSADYAVTTGEPDA
jgi:group II intron reverse transcriptase/maturase